MQRITSRKNQIVDAFRNAAKNPTDMIFLLDGVHLVREAQRSKLGLLVAVRDTLYQSESEAGALARALEAQDIDVYVVNESVMAAMSPTKTPQGIVAVVARDGIAPTRVFDDPDALVAAPVDVQDPGNVGAIIRAAEALGATATWLCGVSANPFGWKALRGSMGSTLRLPVGWGDSAQQLLQSARPRGVRSVAAVPRNGKSPDQIDWRPPTILFVGGEGPGLSDEVIASSDERVTIPIAPAVESLNVAVATALLLYEARRQRS